MTLNKGWSHQGERRHKNGQGLQFDSAQVGAMSGDEPSCRTNRLLRGVDREGGEVVDHQFRDPS
jgi:hypothetical protein